MVFAPFPGVANVTDTVLEHPCAIPRRAEGAVANTDALV
jgi:hypothetical protein